MSGNQNERDSIEDLPDRDRSGTGPVGRRSFLKLTGTAAAGSLVAGQASGAPTTRTLEIISTEAPSEIGDLSVNYEFTATGEITPDTDNGRNSAERNDSVTENDDGTWTATGKTGNGFGDAYTVRGRVTEFTASGSFELRLDGETVTADELVSEYEHAIEVVTTEDPSELDYTFTTTGEIARNTDNGNLSAGNNDSVSQNDDGTWTADGYTGNGDGDSYFFDGELTEFGPVEDFVEIRVDGRVIDLGQFEPQRRHVEVVTTEDPSELDYTLTTTGEITRDTDNGNLSAGNNDSISQNDDGTWTADGYTGNGDGDSYFFEGEIADFGPVEEFVEVRVDGEAIDLSRFTPDRHHVEVVTTEDPSEIDYRLTTTGEITRDTDNGNLSAGNNDSISQNADGTWTADGYTGNGDGDSYYFRGELASFGPVEEFVEVRVDGEPVDLEQYRPEPKTIEIRTTEDPSEIDYTFTTTGEVTKDPDQAEANDSVTQNDDGTWTVDGYTGNGASDVFTFRGSLESFGPVVDHADVLIDGEVVDMSDYETQSTSPLVGGGDGYSGTIPESEADFVVSTRGEFERALADASSGDVVYVDGNATIDVGAQELTVPSGVTLASDRGIDGSDGGEITVDVVYGEGPLQIRDDVRVTGVRVTGPNPEYIEYRRPVHSGITVKGTDCEIDNVEISGFTYCGVKLQEAAYVHHSHIHSNAMGGLGYGICCNGTGGHTLVEYNRFNLNRHSVANRGEAGYTVRYNHFDEDAVAYQVGTHRPGGTTLEIHHNTFVPTLHLNSGEDPESHVSIRGVPEDVADIHHNWFYSPVEPDPGRGTESVIQPHVEDEFQNVELSDNHYGSDEPPSDDIGCP